MVQEWFSPRSGVRHALVVLCREVGLDASGAHLFSDHELRGQLASALERERLVAFRLQKPVFRALEKVEELEYVPEEMRPEAETTWIAIELIDDDTPPSPVAYEAYEIEFSDGDVRAGTLDRRGQARVERVVAGSAKVRFPKLDDVSWNKI
jgi:hypothetical protein